MRGVALLFSLVLLVSCDSAGNLSDKEYIAKAQEFSDKGKPHAAVIVLKNALAKNPKNNEARWLLGNIYLELHDGPAAEKELHRAQELGVAREAILVPLGESLLLQREYSRVLSEIQPLSSMSDIERAQIHALRGTAYIGERKLDEAADEFQVALGVNERSVGAQIGYVRLAMMRHKLEEANDRLEKVLTVSPESAKAWSLLGDLRSIDGKAEEAKEAYGKAIALGFNDPSDLLKRAVVQISLGEFEGAENDIRALKEHAPGYLGITYAQGLLYLSRKQYSEAQRAFEEVYNKMPEDMSVVFYLGASHGAQGHIEQGRRYLSLFLRRYPNSSQAAKLLASLLMESGDYAAAESILRPVLARDPNDAEALMLLGETALPQGKSKEGIEYIRRAIDHNPDSAKAHLQLALGLLMEAKYEESLQEMLTVTRVDPELQSGEYLVILGYLRANKIDKAIEAAELLSKEQPDNPHPLTLMAGAYLAKGDEPKAREILLRALQIAPGDPSAAGNLAKLELSKGDLEKARSWYQEILKYDSTHTNTLIALAQLDSRQGHSKEAIARLEYAVKETPEHPSIEKARVLLARHYLRAGMPSKALNSVQGISDANANVNPFVLAITGEAQLALNDATSAKVTFSRLIEIVPESARAHYLLGKTYASLSQADNAYKELGQALEIDADYLPAKIGMARLYISQNKYEEADSLALELERAHPSHPEVLTLKGELAMRQNQPQEAIEAFKKTIELAPGSQQTVMLGAAQWQAGDKEASIGTYEKWLEQHPSDVIIWFNLANSNLLLNRIDEAKTGFSKVVELEPDNVLALNNLAWLLREEDPAKAVAHAEHALELSPDNPLVMDTLGQLLLDQGKTERALRLFRHASEKASDNLDIRYHLALALVRSGHKTEAHQMLKEVLEEQRQFGNKQAAETLLESLGG